MIRLLATAAEVDAIEVRRQLSQPDASIRECLTPYFERSDAFEYTRLRAQRLTQEARVELDRLPNSKAKHILADIADIAVPWTF